MLDFHYTMALLDALVILLLMFLYVALKWTMWDIIKMLVWKLKLEKYFTDFLVLPFIQNTLPILNTHTLSNQLINQPSRTIYNLSLAHLFNELNFQLIWFMNQVQRANCWIEFRTIVELVRFIASPNPEGTKKLDPLEETIVSPTTRSVSSWSQSTAISWKNSTWWTVFSKESHPIALRPFLRSLTLASKASFRSCREANTKGTKSNFWQRNRSDSSKRSINLSHSLDKQTFSSLSTLAASFESLTNLALSPI